VKEEEGRVELVKLINEQLLLSRLWLGPNTRSERINAFFILAKVRLLKNL
jgi:hypothetical protein